MAFKSDFIYDNIGDEWINTSKDLYLVDIPDNSHRSSFTNVVLRLSQRG